jgi:hypothetical protein
MYTLRGSRFALPRIQSRCNKNLLYLQPYNKLNLKASSTRSSGVITTLQLAANKHLNTSNNNYV